MSIITQAQNKQYDEGFDRIFGGRKAVQNPEPETVTISKDLYEDLLDSKAWLECLESAGVDNWDGIEVAQDMYREAMGDDDE